MASTKSSRVNPKYKKKYRPRAVDGENSRGKVQNVRADSTAGRRCSSVEDCPVCSLVTPGAARVLGATRDFITGC